MSTSTTTNLGLVLDNADEPVKTHHRHANENLATLDVTIKSLQDSMDNAKELLGQLGIDAEDHYAVDAETARTTLGVPSLSDIGDIVRQNIPLMSTTTLGGAKLEEHGGLVLRDEKLGIGSLVQESDGYARGGLAEVTAKGHAEQFSTTGKNLLPNVHGSDVINNVTFTLNADNSITVNGKASANTYYVLYTGALSAGTYCLSDGIQNRPSNVIMFINAKGTDGSTKYSIADSSTNPVVTLSADLYQLDNFTVGIQIPVNTICNNLTFYPQLELGSTATEYEPYTGGAPSPSPDYPQEIKVARGRNLFGSPEQVSYDLANKIKYRCYVSVNGDSISINATGSFSLWGDGGLPIGGNYASTYGTKYACKSGETYCVYFTNTLFSALVVFFDSSEKVTSAVTGGNVNYIDNIYSGQSFTCPDGAAYFTLRIGVKASTSGNIYTTKLQLTLGFTPQPYVPYGHVGLEVQGKNLLQNVATSQTKNGVTFTVNADKSITVSGTATAKVEYILTSNPQTWSSPLNMQIQPNTTYVISGGTGSNQSAHIRAWYYDSNDRPLVPTPIGTGESSVSLTTSSDAAYFIAIIYVASGYTCNNLTFYPQLELGTEATPYEPPFHTTTPIPLPSRGWVGSLPDGTADVLTLDGAGKVTWELDTNKYICTGNETLHDTYDLGNGYWRAWLYNVLDANKSVGDTVNLLCTHSIGRKGYNSASNHVYISGGGESILCYAKANDGNGVLVAFTGAEFIYPLATPITEELGYIEDWPTDIPEGAVVTISELDSVGIKYFIDSSVTELAKQWYARAQSEYEDRITSLEEAVAELVTGA